MHKSIVFSRKEVEALLDGRKTQFRTLTEVYSPGDIVFIKERWATLRFSYDFDSKICDDYWECDPKVVKEYMSREGKYFDFDHTPTCSVVYEANREGMWEENKKDRGFSWRSARTMSEWASRILIFIEKFESGDRLLDISNGDVLAEGWSGECVGSKGRDYMESCPVCNYSAFLDSWDARVGKKNPQALHQKNPCVLKYTFSVREIKK